MYSRLVGALCVFVKTKLLEKKKEKYLKESEKMNTNFVINTSKIRGYKSKILALSLIGIFAISIVMAFAPTSLAQPGIAQPIKSFSYISVAPLVIGVGQIATVNYWFAPTSTGYSTSPWYGPPPGYLGTSVTFTRPDGTKDTFMPTQATGNYSAGETDALSSVVFFYTPNMVGNWSVTCSMPAQNFTDASGTVLTAPSTSAPAYFTVTTEAQNAGLLNGYPWSPLPNDNVFWTYPISPNNREWASIAAPMFPQVSGGYWQPYGPAPSTPHILWQLQTGMGGMIGGDAGNIALQASLTTPIILMGKMILNGMNSFGGANCYDLYTGKLLWESNYTVTRPILLPPNELRQSISSTQNTGTVLAATTPPEVYLFGTSTGPTIKGLATQNWHYIDPLTGRVTLTFTNATGGTGIMSPYSNLVYGNVMTDQSTVSPYVMKTNYVWGWDKSKVTGNDWYTGLLWKSNVSRHWGGVDVYGPGDGSARTSLHLSADMSTLVFGGGPGNVKAMGFSTTDGHSVWNTTFNYVCLLIPTQLYNTNYFMTGVREENTYRCYSALTGALVWTIKNPGINVWETQNYCFSNDATTLYLPSPDGTVTAINIADGTKLWTSEPIPTTEIVTMALPAAWHDRPIVAGGFVYVYLGYSTGYELEPIPRFAMTICLNATTGKTVWTLNGAGNPYAEAGGYLFNKGTYDGIQNCIAKGPTSTSVSVQNNVITQGGNVLIEGNVLDQSPASPDTPAVSDASMSEWMDYLHMQNATLLNSPPSPLGVQVTLTAVDPNMNCITIGTTTTDSTGNFYVNWTPQIEGQYTITAAFTGSGSYWPSSAETGCVVNAAAATTPAPTTGTSTSVADMYFVPAIAGIIVVMIIGFVVLFLALRKRP
jgi:hypothetical protein